MINLRLKNMQPILGWLVSVVVPVVLILSTVRLLLNPWFLVFEYNSPGFPADSYGFTLQDRLLWSRSAVDYLVNSADISYLADLRFPVGQMAPAASCLYMQDCTRLYNERELQHMVDVKNVVQMVLRVWVVALGVLVLLGLWAWLSGWWLEYRLAIGRGGWMTAGIMALIILFALLAFNFIFVLFHQLFFTSGTWVFLYSDTLIRLFPERFWRDIFLMVGAIPSVIGIILGICIKR